VDTVMRAMATDEHAAWGNALDAALGSRTGTFKDGAGKDRPVTLRIANAPFGQRDMKLVPAYLDALASRFGAGLRLVDYKKDVEAARKAIDAWVSDQTEQRIPELIAKGDLDDLTRLVLVNAIYLKAAWQTPFSADLTKPASFTKADGSTIQVPTMAATEEFRYGDGAGWKAVELPYVGGSLAMTVIVPDDLAAFEASLDTDALGKITGALSTRNVDLTMPKFGIETRADLGAALVALGMTDAFDPDRADFSGMTTQEQLYISKVIHQADIDVDEKGTTAAAAIAVEMRAMSLPADPVTFHVDRPFLFFVRDVPTGAILFMGRVTEPATR
jgi:serpin B